MVALDVCSAGSADLHEHELFLVSRVAFQHALDRQEAFDTHPLIARPTRSIFGTDEESITYAPTSTLARRAPSSTKYAKLPEVNDDQDKIAAILTDVGVGISDYAAPELPTFWRPTSASISKTYFDQTSILSPLSDLKLDWSTTTFCG